MKRSFVMFALGAALLAAAQSSEAAPYAVYAKYHLATDTTKTIRVSLDPETPIVRGASGIVFDGIFIQLDDAAKGELENVRNISVDFRCADPDCKSARSLLELKAQSFKSNDFGENQILSPSVFNGDSSVETISINVHAKLVADALCKAELSQRMTKGASILPALARAAPATGKKDTTADTAKSLKALLKETDKTSVDLAYSLLVEKGLTWEGKPIVYSFCADLVATVDYAKLSAWLHPEDKTASATAERANNHHLLAASLLPALAGLTSVGPVVTASEQTGLPENVYAVANHMFTVLRAPEYDFELLELDTAKSFGNRVVDQGSTVALVGKQGSRLCFETPCARIVNDRFVAYIDYIETTTSDSISSSHQAHQQVNLRYMGGKWAFDADLHKFLNQDVTFRIAYKVKDQEFDLLSAGPVTVRNLGVVQSFPVVSEVVAAISKAPKKLEDLEVQSSIPLSYAIDLKGGPSRAAVTFPWMIGFNTRTLPNLADYVRIFPHVSLVFPGTAAADKTQVAFGGGVALAQAFTFSVASSVGDTPTPYFMIGISAPDLVKVLQ